MAPLTDDCVTITMGENLKPILAESSTATKYLQAFTTRYEPPAAVFCSRELESGLAAFVEEEVSLLSCGGGKAAVEAAFPDDEAIRARARDILKTPSTAADDPVLLEKFKGMMKGRLGLAATSFDVTQPQMQMPPQGLDLGGLGNTMSALELLAPTGLDLSFPPEMDMALTDSDLMDILQDINLDLGDIPELPCPGGATTSTQG